MFKLPPPTTGICEFCAGPADGRCDDCHQAFNNFRRDVLGGGEVPTTYALFRMWRRMEERIEDLEDLLEIARIKSKYDI